MENYKAAKVTIVGRVQGVGFRPFIFTIADKYEISGTVQNNMDGVKIFAEGKVSSLFSFIEEIKIHPPRISRIDQVTVEEIEVQGFHTFTIIESDRSGKSSLVIPVDTAVCSECLEEMADPTNFRYQYPFINCTQCGPRYTIIRELPYDRPYTTMKEFQMCEKCQKEYEDPTNRRHHAQPIACPTCGPIYELTSIHGERIDEGLEAIFETKKHIKDGKIVAIKGIGGYHLACDATNEDAVSRLRERKNRPNRPLAVMAASIPAIERVASLSQREIELLHSPEAPIVIVKKKKTVPIAQGVAPGMNTLGLFLPYTPLHNLLFSDQQLEYLILTSANPSGLPILYRDDEAYSYLEGIANFVLSSTRKIDHPIDDSVVQVVNGEAQFFRRARGYVPDPLFTEHEVNGVIALGPQQKNTFAIGRFDQIFIGPHIGDMETIEVTEHYMNEFRHLMKWMGVKIEALAVDKHPLYETGKLALELDCPTIIPVQHHHAHHVACMEDNYLKEPCFGIILDGTGYGLDENIWGFELLYGNSNSFERLGHLSYHPLPGGEKAVKEPWRNAVGFLLSQFGKKVGKELSNKLFVNKTKEIDVISTMLDKGMNSPLAGTCGRLFDVVSAITGVSHISTYDGEAAILFSELVDVKDVVDEYYPYELTMKAGMIDISVKKMIAKIIKEVQEGKEVKQIALKFHETIVQMCLSLILVAVQTQPTLTKKVVLSGGSFHNRYLTTRLISLLEKHGFQVFTHKNVPCNDGGISLGQMIIAAEKYKQLRREMKNVCWSSS